METMKDINGKTIKEGDFILYAAARLSTAHLDYAKVLKKVMVGGPTRGKQALKVGRANRGIKTVTNIDWYGRILVIKKSSVPAKIRRQLEVNFAD